MSKGFTLVELLVVLVIMGLTASVVAPDLFNTLKKIQKRGEIDSIKAIVEVTKEKSFFTAEPYLLSFKANKFSVYKFSNITPFDEQPISLNLCLDENSSENESETKQLNTGQEFNASCSEVKSVVSNFYTFDERNVLISQGRIAEPLEVEIFEANVTKSLTLALF